MMSIMRVRWTGYKYYATVSGTYIQLHATPMAKHPFRDTRCVHCLKHFPVLTADHVMPEAWYPDGTFGNAKKWSAPSCSECNRKLGAIEQDLLIRFALCIREDNPAGAGLFQMAMRAMNPGIARNERDAAARKRLLLRMVGDMAPCPGHPHGLLTRAGHLHDHEPGGGVKVRIPIKSIYAVGDKMARGLEFVMRSRWVETDRKIGVLTPEGGENEINALIDKWNELITPVKRVRAIGPGLKLTYGVDPSDDDIVIYHLTLWDHWDIWCSIFPSARATP